jgi:hypothetical protein
VLRLRPDWANFSGFRADMTEPRLRLNQRLSRPEPLGDLVVAEPRLIHGALLMARALAFPLSPSSPRSQLFREEANRKIFRRARCARCRR